jgi:outer membrane protein assembly factor BamB
MRRIREGILTTLSLSLWLATISWADSSSHWPQFRGPASNGLTTEEKLPTEWSHQKNLLWKSEVPGEGWSSPIVWADRIFITTAIEIRVSKAKPEPVVEPSSTERSGQGPRLRPSGSIYSWRVYCLDKATGKILWNRTAFEGKPTIRTHKSNTYASETPATDGKRVYAYFGMTGLFCYDFGGKLIWEKDLGSYPMQRNWGTASSPLLYKDRLFLQIDNEEDSFIVALDLKTGDERMRIPRDEASNWSSPIIWKNKERNELVAGGRKVRSYDPNSGKLLWQLSMGGGRNCASPVGDDERLYVGNGIHRRGGPGGGSLFAVKAGASGDITPQEGRSTSTGVLWSQPMAGPPMASPLVYKGFVYILARRKGQVSCYNAETGEPAYRDKQLEGARAFWASPWAYDNKVFCPDDSGTTHLLQTGAELKVLATNKLSDKFWASSAPTGQTIIFRGVDYIYCIKK